MGNRKIVLASDIHGEFETLFNALSPDDILFIAGDLLNFMDFTDLTKGILYQAFTMEELIEGLKEMSKGNYERIREALREITTPGEERYEKIKPLIYESYEELARNIRCETYILFGNDDYPDLLKEIVGNKAEIMDSGTVSVDGVKLGLVSGLPESERYMGLPGEISKQTFRERLFGLGKVDIIITHIPPDANPEESDLTYDVLAKRHEPSSPDLSEYIKKYDPKYSFFGHVHNPKVDRAKIGNTMAFNLGFFKLRKKITRINSKTLEMEEIHV